MSAFDIFNSSAIKQALPTFGQVSFTLESKTIYAVLNDYSAEVDLMIGGKVGTYLATLTGDRSQLGHITGLIERVILGASITINSRAFKITACHLDEVSFTLGLSNPSKGK
jgi:hypothetical protein